VVAVRITSGTSLSRDITVLGLVDGQRAKPVYLVWHHRAWCPMACKLFKSLAQAEREAAVLRSFAHPNIVRCLGTGRPGFMLMEFLEGPTLSAFIRSRPGGHLSIADALRAAIYLGSALIHMHGRGYLHLDVKPSNVIVVRGRPVLFDLDIARSDGEPRHAHVSGTASYMAPEQCRREALTRTTDVFGVGVTLYQALTGALPFPERRGRSAYPQTKVDATPLRQHLPRAPEGLETILQECLARNPADRPTLRELLPALHAFVTTGPKMWPDGFDPGVPVKVAADRRRRAAQSERG
jgi:eukaryotic-like serine/threonine-protein kinase